ncbi:hypothetical protein YB2330_002398 [Saitoella coloradoensis]
MSSILLRFITNWAEVADVTARPISRLYWSLASFINTHTLLEHLNGILIVLLTHAFFRTLCFHYLLTFFYLAPGPGGLPEVFPWALCFTSWFYTLVGVNAIFVHVPGLRLERPWKPLSKLVWKAVLDFLAVTKRNAGLEGLEQVNISGLWVTISVVYSVGNGWVLLVRAMLEPSFTILEPWEALDTVMKAAHKPGM